MPRRLRLTIWLTPKRFYCEVFELPVRYEDDNSAVVELRTFVI